MYRKLDIDSLLRPELNPEPRGQKPTQDRDRPFDAPEPRSPGDTKRHWVGVRRPLSLSRIRSRERRPHPPPAR